MCQLFGPGYYSIGSRYRLCLLRSEAVRVGEQWWLAGCMHFSASVGDTEQPKQGQKHPGTKTSNNL